MNHLYFGDCLDLLKELLKEHPETFKKSTKLLAPEPQQEEFTF